MLSTQRDMTESFQNIAFRYLQISVLLLYEYCIRRKIPVNFEIIVYVVGLSVFPLYRCYTEILAGGFRSTSRAV